MAKVNLRFPNTKYLRRVSAGLIFSNVSKYLWCGVFEVLNLMHALMQNGDDTDLAIA